MMRTQKTQVLEKFALRVRNNVSLTLGTDTSISGFVQVEKSRSKDGSSCQKAPKFSVELWAMSSLKEMRWWRQ